ncbi:type II toxin-antitoxin system RelE family toxin [Phreatobacter stygius]|uniref:type II toxin-antitoxin system RelE family toxin n=1 Tax=Phreatobacter stygius TaxID=1940610 RepID=UPI001FEA3418|nr:plasmid stabilization protein [Phreatobacter stygius]
MKTIILTASAARELDALPGQARLAVTEALVGYAIHGRGDVKALSGRQGYRMRVGQYRVIFGEDSTTILAIYIGRGATTTDKGNRNVVSGTDRTALRDAVRRRDGDHSARRI